MIRKMIAADKNFVIDMMRRFYNSPALITNGSEKIYFNNVESFLIVNILICQTPNGRRDSAAARNKRL